MHCIFSSDLKIHILFLILPLNFAKAFSAFAFSDYQSQCNQYMEQYIFFFPPLLHLCFLKPLSPTIICSTQKIISIFGIVYLQFLFSVRILYFHYLDITVLLVSMYTIRSFLPWFILFWALNFGTPWASRGDLQMTQFLRKKEWLNLCTCSTFHTNITWAHV